MKLPRLLKVLVFAFAGVPNAAFAQRDVHPYFQISGGPVYGSDKMFGTSGIPLIDGVFGVRTTPQRKVSYLAGVFGGIAAPVGGSADEVQVVPGGSGRIRLRLRELGTSEH